MPTNPQSGRRPANRTALINGASRGIGRAIAPEFAVEGADLFLCATGLEKLRETRTIVSEFGGRTEPERLKRVQACGRRVDPCVALETAAHGVNVNVICHGFVETDTMAEMQTYADILGVSLDQVRQVLLARIPMGRLLQPEEVAHQAVYLACSESDGMTGQALTISCGPRRG